METKEEQAERIEKQMEEARANRAWFLYFEDSEEFGFDWTELSPDELELKQMKYREMKNELREVYDFLRKNNLSFKKREKKHPPLDCPIICPDCQCKLAFWLED